MKCKCFEDLEQKVKEKCTKANMTDIECGFKHRALVMTESPYSLVMLPVEFSYRLIKKDGSKGKNTRTETVSIAPTYCPFCGEKISKE